MIYHQIDYQKYSINIFNDIKKQYFSLDNEDKLYVNQYFLPMWFKISRKTNDQKMENAVRNELCNIMDKHDLDNILQEISINLLELSLKKNEISNAKDAIDQFLQIEHLFFGGFSFLTQYGEFLAKMVRKDVSQYNQYMNLIEKLNIGAYHCVIYSFLAYLFNHFKTDSDKIQFILLDCISRLKNRGCSQNWFLSCIISFICFSTIEYKIEIANDLYKLCKKVMISDDRVRCQANVSWYYYKSDDPDKCNELFKECIELIINPRYINPNIRTDYEIKMNNNISSTSAIDILLGKTIPIRTTIDETGCFKQDSVSFIDLNLSTDNKKNIKNNIELWFHLVFVSYKMEKEKQAKKIFQHASIFLDALSNWEKNKFLIHFGNTLCTNDYRSIGRDLINQGLKHIISDLKNGIFFSNTNAIGSQFQTMNYTCEDFIYEITELLKDLIEADEKLDNIYEKRIHEIIHQIPDELIKAEIFYNLSKNEMTQEKYETSIFFSKNSMNQILLEMKDLSKKYRKNYHISETFHQRLNESFNLIEKIYLLNIEIAISKNDIKSLSEHLDKWISKNDELENGFSILKLYHSIFNQNQEFTFSHNIYKKLTDLSDTVSDINCKIELQCILLNYLTKKW